MRRPCSDREEKRVTHRSDTDPTASKEEQLDFHDPNQISDLAPVLRSTIRNSA
jgi:hypothetical protein